MSIIFLSGFSNSGKTTLGRLASESLNINFADLDQVIEKEIKQSINSFFTKFGEEQFRKIESNVLQNLIKQDFQVIALGGGTIKNNNNYQLLKQNGKIIYLKRDLNEIKKGLFCGNRPLLKNKLALKKLFVKRKRLNEKRKDYIFYVAKRQDVAVASLAYRLKYYLSVIK